MVRITPGSVGIVQAAKLCKIAGIMKGGQDCVMPTQEYIRKLIEDVVEDVDFTRGSLVSAVEYEGSIMMRLSLDFNKKFYNSLGGA
ncbi:hypothetical protein Tco_0947074, partial [Tanacetum coccineum]